MIYEQKSEAGIFQEHSNLKSEESRMDIAENSEILQKISSNDLCGSGSMNCKSNINSPSSVYIILFIELTNIFISNSNLWEVKSAVVEILIYCQ